MASKSSSDLIELRAKLVGGSLVVSGNKNIKKSIEGVGKATSETSTRQRYAASTTSRLTSSYKKLGSAAKWGLGFLGVGGVLAIESSIHASEELGKTTIGLTRNLDLQNNVASRWGAVAQAREIDSKSLTMAFTTLSRRMVEAGRQGGTLLTPFHQLGLTQEDAAKGAKDFEWGLMRVATALGEAKGGSVRQAAAQQLLGRGYSMILPLFSEGTKGLKEQLHWADKYGVTLSGKTTDGLMEMVQAQRESKVAMLGLQLSLTKALMPAIHAGEDQLHEFIATLNSPHLTAEQKISRISHQFLMLEDDLVHILEQALPHIAEQGGHLGIALAGAVWHGFIHSDALGKLVIAGWLFKSLGGASLIKAQAREAGLLTGRWFAAGTVAGIILSAPLIGLAIGEAIPLETRVAMRQWGINAGQNFVNGLIWMVNQGIQEINNTLDEINALSFLGVEAPNIGEIGKVNFHSDIERQEAEVHNAPPGSVNGPGGSIIGPHGEQIKPPVGNPDWRHPKHHRHHGRHRSLPRAAREGSPRIKGTAQPREHRRGRAGISSVTVPMGNASAKPVGGLGGWKEVEIQDDLSVSDWEGQPLLREDVPLLLDAYPGGSVQREWNTIKKLGRDPNGEENVPPVFRVYGPLDSPDGKAWVLPDDGIEILDGEIEPIKRSDGDWQRIEFVLHLMEYRRPDTINVRPKRHRHRNRMGVGPARAISYTTQQGDTLEKIAAHVLGDWKLWDEIGKKNGIRDPKRKLPAGMELRL